MPAFFFLIFVLVLAVAGLYLFANTEPRALLRHGRRIGGVVMLLIAGVLAFVGRWGIAAPLAFFGFSLLLRGGSLGFPGMGNANKSPGQSSRVRSRFLDMRLDHDTGEMSGSVRSGSFAGRELDDLGLGELRDLYGEISDDAESVSLLETYLDTRHPDWRDTMGAHRGTGGGDAAGQSQARSPMTVEEACQVLGVTARATTRDIRTAHRKLMKNLHPDQGGSNYLAAKLNEARDLLLARLGKRR